jgi:ligand-binding sensor domain-containing protein
VPPKTFRASARSPRDCQTAALEYQAGIVTMSRFVVRREDKPRQLPQYRYPGTLMAVMIAVFAILIAVGGLSGVAHAQTYNFHHYDTDDGLPQVQVLSVYRDDTGYLWVGTYGGLSRYDGQEFRNYTTKDGLGANVVEAVVMDASGQLWVGTGAGLCRLGSENRRFECLDAAALDTAYVHDLHTEAGTLWAATDAGLFRYREGSVRRYGISSGLPSPDIRSIERDKEGVLWVGTVDGLARLESESDGFTTVQVPADAGRQVTALLADGDRLWIGLNEGLYRYQAGEITAAAGIPSKVSNSEIVDLELDRAGKLWAATSLGVLRQQDDAFQLLTRKNGLRYDITFDLFTGREGLVWIGHDQGLTKWVPSPFVGYNADHGLIDPFVRTINEDEKRRLWLGTRVGIQVVPYRDGKWRIEESEIITTEEGLRDGRVYSIDFWLFPASSG